MLDQVLTNKLMKKDADGVIEYTRSLGNKWFDTIEQPTSAENLVREILSPNGRIYTELTVEEQKLIDTVPIDRKLEIQKEVDTNLVQSTPQVVTQPAPVVPKVIDIIEHPAENSTADVLKDTESISNDISSSIFGTAPVVEVTPGPKVISGSLFATKEEAEAKGLTDKQLAEGDKLNEQYKADPNAPREAEEAIKQCNSIKK
jgi:hypothetical protein